MPDEKVKMPRIFLLNILKAALTGAAIRPEDCPETAAFSDVQLWHGMLGEAERHLVLPMICKAADCADIVSQMDDAVREEFDRARKKAEKEVVRQYKRTAAFLDLYEYLAEKGIHPLIIKGLVCRSVYPFPEYRQSWDEDILISPDEYEACREALLSYGMCLDTGDREERGAYEIIYKDYTSGMVLEVHKTLFTQSSPVFRGWNQYFSDAFTQRCSMEIDDAGEPIAVWTLSPQQHLFFLICHTFKHFLYFGAGLRQVTDILLFSRKYGKEIDWQLLREQCCRIMAEKFTAGIFAIGERFLGFDPSAAGVPPEWMCQAVDTDILLEDILEAGMQANTAPSRIHSSNITLNALETEAKGKKKRPAVSLLLASVFPPYRSLRSRFSYLEGRPYLLPAAWAHRIIRYGAKTGGSDRGREAADTIRIGNSRIALLRSLNILGNSGEVSARKYALFQDMHTDQPKQKSRSFSARIKNAGNGAMGGAFAPAASMLWKVLFSAEWKYLDFIWRMRGFMMPGPEEQKQVRKQVTFIYKSFERKKMAVELYENIQRFYPGAQVIIADDSRVPLVYDAPFLHIVHLPFNSGLSYGVAKALEKVQTPYVMRLDDDELLTRRTHLGKQLMFLRRHPEADLVAFGFITVAHHDPKSSVWPEYYTQTMEEASRKLLIRHMTRLDETHIVLGKGPNIYLARTESIRKVGYDTKIRMIDHHDFFLRAAGILVTVGAMDSFVFHRHDPFDTEYQKYRKDIRGDQAYLKEKYQRN